MDKLSFFTYKVDPEKDQAIDDFLRTPIDSRSTPVDDGFKIHKSDNPNQAKREIKNAELTKKQIMNTWNRAITKMSKRAISPPKPRITSRSAMDGYPSLVERTINQESTLQKNPFSEFEEESQQKTVNNNIMPLRKNDIPIGRHYSNNLVLKRTTNKYFKR